MIDPIRLDMELSESDYHAAFVVLIEKINEMAGAINTLELKNASLNSEIGILRSDRRLK